MTRPAAQPEWRSLSFRMIWVDLLQSLVSMLPAVAAFGVVGMDSGSSAFWALIGLAAFGLLGALMDAWRWVFTRYRITGALIELRTGLIFRQHRAIRRERIRSVDVEARLRHRLGGLRILKIGAGQQHSAGETALSLDALSTADALALQAALIDAPADPAPGTTTGEAVREDTDAAGTDPAPAVPRQVFARFTPRWAVHNTFSVWAFALALGLGWGGLWVLESFGLNVIGYVSGLLDWGALGWGVSITLAIAVVWLLGCLGLTVNYFTEFWNFELSRVPGPEGTQLRTRKGLFTTREVNRDENRFRGLSISEPLLLRWLRVADTRVITTGLDEWSMSDPAAILPRTPVTFARRVANAVLGTDLFDRPLQSHPGAALRRRLWWATGLSAVGVVMLAGLALTGMIGWAWLWVGLPVWVLSLAGAIQAYRNLGHRITDQHLITRSGLLNRNTVVLQREAVSTIAVRESLLQRRLGLRTVATMTSAGAGGYDTPDLAREDALAFARRAAPGLLEPFIVEDPRHQDPGHPTAGVAPVTTRLLAPDLARGFMLLLIAMAYAGVYVGAAFGTDAATAPVRDQVAVVFSTLFLDNRAFPMFAILFGIGVSWSVTRRQARNVPARDIRRTLRRRAWWLLLFGAVHAVLVFPGEILTSYGFALLVTGWLLFRSNPTLRNTLLITGVFYLVTVPAMMLVWQVTAGMDATAELAGYLTAEDWFTRIFAVPFNPIYLAIAYPLLFLVVLGYRAGREDLFENPAAHRRLLRRVTWGGIGISLLGALPVALTVTGVISPGDATTGLLLGIQVLTGVAGGAGYAAAFALYSQRVTGVAARAVAAVGKRSLSCYILNSILVALILHPDLFGWDTGAFGALLTALLAWSVSLLLANWLEHLGRRGPLEALMRRAVNGRRGQPPQ